jgi:UDP-3-O-[3-hydroxymyristoyl] glucosamine N-acyltransferase
MFYYILLFFVSDQDGVMAINVLICFTEISVGLARDHAAVLHALHETGKVEVSRLDVASTTIVRLMDSQVKIGAVRLMGGHVKLGEVRLMDGHVKLCAVRLMDGHVKLGEVRLMDGHVKLGAARLIDGHVKLGAVRLIDGHVKLGAVRHKCFAGSNRRMVNKKKAGINSRFMTLKLI